MSVYEDSFEGSDTTSSWSSSPPSPLRGNFTPKPDVVEPQPRQSAPPAPVPVPVKQALADTSGPLGDTATSTATAATAEEGAAAAAAGAPFALLRPAAAASSVASTDSSPRKELKSSSVVGDAGGRGRDTASGDTTYSNIERKLGGINAAGTDEFQALTSYVAFGDSPPSSTGVASAAADGGKKGSRDTAADTAVGDALPTKTPAAVVPLLTEAEDPSLLQDSSVLSTLSQHLRKSLPQGEGPNSAAQLRAAAATAASAIAGPPGVAAAKGGGGAMAPLLLTQPAASVPSLSPSKGPPAPPAAPPRLEGVLASLPPPLPSRDPRQDPKIVELRETSEAVERLVRAFALLRGHVAASSPDPLADAKAAYATKDTEQLSSLRQQHGVGDAATVRMRHTSSRRPYLSRPKPADAAQDANETAALQLNEAAVEDAIMCLVMELMQRDAKQPFENNIERKAIHPSLEVVGMDNFQAAPPSKPHRVRGTVTKELASFSVFEGGMQAFAPGDTDASDSLYNSVFQALQKYVWAHVAASTRLASSHFPPVSAHFAWVLQLDLLLVCMQALESRFAGDRAGTRDGSAVLIQYEGSREAEPLARNAAHCLPFEALDARRREKPVFRLEYWVTKEKLWTVVEALTASIREGVVARSDGYRAFSSEYDEELRIDPNALLPTRVPLFSLVAPQRLGAAEEEERHDLRKGPTRKEEEESSTNFFHIHPKTLESLAHAVSTAGTELLEADVRTAGKRTHYAQRYQDATAAVTEAVCELLGDAGIRAAVQRRATAKLTELAKRREADNTVSRQEKERRLIEAAEEEAERVVQRILQEMRVEEARDT
ncbi:uncharacterized protein Tco025E_04741 [Trypanosoma conorhini]|uniref:Uncharacterized protein n=1 Tax=Trypanosoma conorhini TaxID=83891 RepID=A0A422PJE4_9TRYP|nr:uncharacterized protein Tco025E_04741 [Trypanosoma conorhini]RNF17834.1 hypothetical protein Tco025E_04741 [Trypanosoma conorhini]